MGLFNMNKESIEKVLNYIFDTEQEDFAEYPSDNHVFYHALVCSYGKAEADKILNETKKENEQ